ncbi:phenylalanine ammonia-lyase [Delitschia confertaspora ATCC 74209]|uniref:Phenylalanine ammonia-lyase n=1 Tax=Delitschia confertaspora ATCC 74209 TaxID=1513339 RepID=A0A9P4JQI0_9PLEO|nr:phenylalanine ammonia-lyase [Delitschia confertaspora ATCC 74209]
MEGQLKPCQLHSDIVSQEWIDLKKLLDSRTENVILDGEHLTLAAVIAVARYRSPATFDSQAYTSSSRSLETLRSRLDKGEVIYGVNTGFGGTADVRNKRTQQLQRVLIRELHYGILSSASRDPKPSQDAAALPYQFDLSNEQLDTAVHLPETWTRAAILIRLNSLLKGHSAIRQETLESLLDLLRQNIIPIIPLRGSISASGDLSPLSYLGGAIQGKPTIRIHSKSEELYADTAFARAGLSPVTLEAKEGLAIVNGTAVSTASAALALHDANILSILSQIMTAMSVEALAGTIESFDPFFSECRPHPGQIDAAKNICSFLRGSSLIQEKDGAGHTLRQDRYSIRTAPQWIGPILEDLALAHQQVSIECNSTTDNPLISPDGRVLHGGNFQAKALTSAMEKTRQGIQSLGRMLFTQCVEIINPATSFGLPPNLVAEDPSTSYIFKGTDICIAALQAELGFLSNPVNHVQTAELGNQSLNSLALISARYTHMSNDVLAQMMATHLLALVQALDLRALKERFFQNIGPGIASIVADNWEKEFSSEETAADRANLHEKLCTQLQASFDNTVSMDARDRFPAISQSLRFILLDDPTIHMVSEPLKAIDKISSLLSSFLLETWRLCRDSYIAHGDATHLLGHASKAMYNFIRRDLGIPFLASNRLTTPNVERIEDPDCTGNLDGSAPTVGSYNSAIYRSIRDGSITQIIMDVLSEAKSRHGE